MKDIFKAFRAVLLGETKSDLRLGNPSDSEGDKLRRLATFAQLRGGKGFRSYPAEPVVRANGLTRGAAKRLRRATANAAEMERREGAR